MTFLAATDFGDYAFLVIMLVFGLINWIAGKLKGEDKPPAKPTARPSRNARPAAPRTETAEEERMRRFMEALGIPAGEEAPKPAPPRPVIEPRPVVTPRPVAEPRPVVASPRRVAPPPPLPPVLDEPSLDELEAPTRRAEEIALPELSIPKVPDFATVSSRVSALPEKTFLAASSMAEEARVDRSPSAANAELLRMLRSAGGLRQAFVLREVLGPPRSLQR